MILVAGSANLDFVVRAPRIPVPGETVLGDGLRTFPGGKGANQAIASARAGGAETAMLLALGDDPYAEPLEASLREAGVRMHVVRAVGMATGTAFVCVSSSGENAITVAPGANNALAPSHLPALDAVSHLLMQLETPLETVAAYAKAARARGVTVVLNAAPGRELPPELLESVDVLVLNEGELRVVSRHGGAIEECLQRVAVACIVVTLGARGCCARSGNQMLRQPAFAVEPVDTTAAGDTFCGVLVASLGAGAALPEALRRAGAAAALACTRPGAQASIPTRAEVDSFLARQRTGSR